MKFKQFINEKKDHLINKINNLTSSEKKEIIRFFNKHPNLENQINWNDLTNLYYDDFKPLLNNKSKTYIKKQVKQNGIKGLQHGTDYLELPEENGYKIYIPLSWEASKYIASKYIEDVEGKWCTALQNDDSQFRIYTKDGILFYICGNNKKYAILLKNKHIEIYDQTDTKIQAKRIKPKVNVNKIISYNKINDLAKSKLFEFGCTPDHIYGSFDLEDKNILDLKTLDFPNLVKGNMLLAYNKLTNLEWLPKEIKKDLSVDFNQLITLKGCSEKVGGCFWCYNNKLTSLEYGPNYVGEDYNCSSNQLTNFIGSPEHIYKDFDCSNNPIVSLEGFPKIIEGNVKMFHTKIKFSEQDIRNICDVKGRISI